MSVAIICAPFWVNDSFFFLELNGWVDRWAFDQPAIMFAQAGISVAVTLASGMVMAWKWPPMRSLWFAVVALVLATCAWFIPSLCVLALIGSIA